MEKMRKIAPYVMGFVAVTMAVPAIIAAIKHMGV